MRATRANKLARRTNEELATDLGVAMGPPSKAVLTSLTTDFNKRTVDEKVRIAVYLARYGVVITFDKRFEAFCGSPRYTRLAHLTNVELHLLQRGLGLAGPPASVVLPADIADYHDTLLGQDPFIQYAVTAVLKSMPERNFIQVGANDLRGADDQFHRWIIESPEWTCLLLEPQPVVFERLKETVRDAPNVIPINAAIAGHDGTAELTVFRLDTWSSMAPQTLAMRERFNEPATVVEVQCQTAASLLRDHGIENPGFLMIDTEGLDKIILDQFLDTSRPGVIICEIAHIPDEEMSGMLTRLREAGYVYSLVNRYRDVMAIRSGLIVEGV
ncbi:MAG: FkbM family methyltransferase [Alphaproteobacteria bacterium]|jgi:FkbM family methyltransferase|nr:FkbM family methyltransferase [Alphaproteobacteria bacterium]